MTQWTLIPFTRKARKARGKETTRAKESPKAGAKERASKMGKERVLGKASRIKNKFQGTCRNCGKTGHKWRECWAKGGGAAKKANIVGETGDVNWIMMVENLSVGQPSTSESEIVAMFWDFGFLQKRTRVTCFHPCRVRSRCSQF